VGNVTEETINGIKVKPQVGPDRQFTVNELIDVAYDPPRALVIPFQPIQNGEVALRTGAADAKARMAQLIKDYTSFLDKMKDEKAVSLRRHIQYRLAVLKAAVADNNEGQREAIAALEKFRKENTSGWQLIPAVRQLVQLLADLDRLDAAADVLEETATKTPG